MCGKFVFFVICAISSVLAAPQKNGCSLKMPTDLPKTEPVLLYAGNAKASLELFKPTGQDNVLPTGSRLTLVCTGNKNVIKSLNKQSVELQCGADGKFSTVDGNVEHDLNELECNSIPASDLKPTDEPCASNKGKIYEAGFDIDGKFFTVFTICFNSDSETTYFAHNVINGAAINHAHSQSVRRPFRSNGMRFSTAAVNKMYKNSNQLARFKALFGASQPFITQTMFMARGHMAPDADFIFGYEQLATYFYINCAPEFQVVNAGNWVRVENLARTLAGSFGSDLEIYTGTMGLLHLSNGSKKQVPIYLDDDKLVYAPEYYFKVIKHEPTDSAIVMISSNNPFAKASDIKEKCKNVCERAGVANSIFADPTRGYTYCCELDDFRKIYADLPKSLQASKLLNGAEAEKSAAAPQITLSAAAIKKPFLSKSKSDS